MGGLDSQIPANDAKPCKLWHFLVDVWAANLLQFAPMSFSIISIQIIGLGGIITARPPLYA
jgi:hypothetical protein